MTFVCAVGKCLTVCSFYTAVYVISYYTSVSSACSIVFSSPVVFLDRLSCYNRLLLWYGLLLFLCQSDSEGVRLSDYNRICPRIQAVYVSISLAMSTLSSILPVNNMYSSLCFQQTCSKLTFTCF